MTIPVFDGHNDFVLRLLRQPERRAALWLEAGSEGHLDLPRLRTSGFVGGLFALFVPSAPLGDRTKTDCAFDAPAYDLPLAPGVSDVEAARVLLALANHLHWMVRASSGAFRLCRSVAEVRACMRDQSIAGIMHLEGAEALDADLTLLDRLCGLGLRSIGPVWSRANIFGQGVPFRFPSGPDIGPGLTEAGRRLVAECNRRRILIDLSHLNEAGFFDVARLSDAPLVATHSGAHAVTPSSRNLTDRQLAMIAESGGMVGLNFSTILLRRDGRRSPVMGWTPVLRHLDHLIAHLGEDHVGLGSDFDGTTVPTCIGDVTGLAALQKALRTHGYDPGLMRKLCHENWLSVLEHTWGQ